MNGEPFPERTPAGVWWNPGDLDRTAQAAVQEFGGWMGRVPWHTWGTFTYAPRNPVTGEAVIPTVDSARRSIEWFLGEGLIESAVWVTEKGSRFGRVHNHALLSGFNQDLAPMDRAQLQRMWEARHGFARLEQFDPSRGAAGYVGKYLRKQDCDWDLWQASNNSPTKRSGSRNGSSTTKTLIPMWLSGTRQPTSQSARSSAARRRKSRPDSDPPRTSEICYDGTRRETRGSSTNLPGNPGISRIRLVDWPGR